MSVGFDEKLQHFGFRLSQGVEQVFESNFRTSFLADGPSIGETFLCNFTRCFLIFNDGKFVTADGKRLQVSGGGGGGDDGLTYTLDCNFGNENDKPVKPDVPKDYEIPADLEDRLILPLLNEAVSCLHDGVVADADLLDAGVIFGTGFAPFRGGPIQHIRTVGAAPLKARLEQLAQRYGARFNPRPGWDVLV